MKARGFLRYIAPKDIHPYSIDEVFIEAGQYLSIYKMSAHELAMTMIREVLEETGITATAGIGTNMYLILQPSICRRIRMVCG